MFQTRFVSTSQHCNSNFKTNNIFKTLVPHKNICQSQQKAFLDTCHHHTDTSILMMHKFDKKVKTAMELFILTREKEIPCFITLLKCQISTSGSLKILLISLNNSLFRQNTNKGKYLLGPGYYLVLFLALDRLNDFPDFLVVGLSK